MSITPIEPLGFVFRWFWLLAIVTGFANAGIYYVKSRRHIVSRPELATSYPILIKRYLVWSNIPWIVMGLVILSGGANNIFDFLRPREAGVGILLWYVSIGLLWFGTACWILFRDGDVVLSKHSAFFSDYFPRSPYIIRLFTIFALGVGVIIFMVLWSGQIRFRQ